MPSRPDLRDIASNVKEAFADADRETLLDVLTFVLKEYVVEGPPPMLVHQAETLSDLRGASFATLISALQTRFEFPELALFVVDGENVSVRVGGVIQPLAAGRQPLTGPPPAQAAPPPQAQTAPAPQPQPAPVVQSIPTRPGATMVEVAPRPAPPASRGLTVRGRNAGDDAGAAPPIASVPPPPPAGQAPQGNAVPADKGDKQEGSGDDASARFSLLELD